MRASVTDRSVRLQASSPTSASGPPATTAQPNLAPHRHRPRGIRRPLRPGRDLRPNAEPLHQATQRVGMQAEDRPPGSTAPVCRLNRHCVAKARHTCASPRAGSRMLVGFQAHEGEEGPDMMVESVEPEVRRVLAERLAHARARSRGGRPAAPAPPGSRPRDPPARRRGEPVGFERRPHQDGSGRPVQRVQQRLRERRPGIARGVGEVFTSIRRKKRPQSDTGIAAHVLGVDVHHLDRVEPQTPPTRPVGACCAGGAGVAGDRAGDEVR